jgi:hypothetical protein
VSVANLPAVLPPGHHPEDAIRAELNVVPVAQRAQIRRFALEHSQEAIANIRSISNEAGSPMVRLLASKALLAVAAVLGGSTIPRDLVMEKVQLTNALLVAKLPRDLYEEMVLDLREIWSDV